MMILNDFLMIWVIIDEDDHNGDGAAADDDDAQEIKNAQNVSRQHWSD